MTIDSVITLKSTHNRWLFWGVLTFISYKLLSPVNQTTVTFLHFDKLVHAAIFFVLTWLLLRAYNLTRTRHYTLWGIYGALIEYLQALTGYRSGDIFDWIADMIGVVLLFASLDLWKRYKPHAR